MEKVSGSALRQESGERQTGREPEVVLWQKKSYNGKNRAFKVNAGRITRSERKGNEIDEGLYCKGGRGGQSDPCVCGMYDSSYGRGKKAS